MVAAGSVFDGFRQAWIVYQRSQGVTAEAPSDGFLHWLIGFAEGDGCFSVNQRRELAFILVQGQANRQLLEAVHSQLRLGHVLFQGPRVLRLIVQRRSELALIVLLFNGRLVLPTRKAQFARFLEVFRARSPEAPSYQSGSHWPSPDTAWLLGFAEAEGCFTVSLLANSSAFRLRFILSQKGDVNLPVLSRCIQLFGVGAIEGHSRRDNYSYVASGLRAIPGLRSYFDRHLALFQGIKKNAYLAFLELAEALGRREHLNPRLRPGLVQKAAAINATRRKAK